MQDPKFIIVGIGASAGGLEAFRSFFESMPAEPGMAFVVILHLPADRKSLLPEILARWTSMRVEEVSQDKLIEPNCVYVPSPHTAVTITEGRLRMHLPKVDDEKSYHPIDAFFDSLASSLRENAVGIVLSGTGTDGALGLKAIKACGGLTIAQGSDGTRPQYGEMPAGAISTGAVDLVASVDNIPRHLLRMKGRQVNLDLVDEPAQIDSARLAICAVLRAHLGHDFSGYRDKTFLRRVQRRMQIVDAATLEDYIARLRSDRGEMTLLFRDLLIRVTSFFRDKETFEVLESKVIPQLFAGKQADGAVRVWVPGCATGEEAYSLAILLREHMDTLGSVPKTQIFATDIDGTAISTARVGRYPSVLLEGLSTERRKRFFIPTQDGYAISKEIRDLCTFSAHSLVRDPPFSRMDMVSCRNLLIYMDTKLQAMVIPIFHYSLVRGGILLLGGSESVAQHDDLFEPIDKAARVFRRRDTKSQATLNMLRSYLIAPHEMRGVAAESNGHEISPAERKPASAPSFAKTASADDVSSTIPADNAGDLGVGRFRHLFGTLFPGDQRLAQSQRSLSSTKDELQSLSEEHQTTLEELRSANEELHSLNEELQSTNEELETSKEELQSLNEELHTVNIRLTEKVNELDEANSDLRNLFESTDIATIFLDRYLIIRSFTPAIARLYNLIPSDAGRPLTDIVSRLDYDSMGEDVTRVLETLQPMERQIASADHTAHYIMRLLPYREPDSTVSGALVTFVDVTSIVQAEAALREADLRKDVFLATLSHELRNPLAPIRTAARLLDTPRVAPTDLSRVQAIISRQVTHMSSLLDDLLDVSRITRGAFVLKKEFVEMQTLVEAAAEAAQPIIDAKRHSLSVERPQDPVVMQVDPVRITQVISNLLTNAAKYTPIGGTITLGSSLNAEGLTITVRDNGVGLAPGQLTRIFNMFTQVDSETDRVEGGLGIGLALAKGLVELHGGRIEARSAGLGLGSEVSVWLPASLMAGEPDQALSPAVAAGVSSQSLRVLIADDNRDGAETLGMYLGLSGHEVMLAHTGAEALDMASRCRPDAAVLDIGMPVLNGYEVARSIRREAWGANLTLIAVTGWGQESDKRSARAAGFDHHLTKPVDPEQLERLLTQGKSARA
ncbi:MAG TPA: CheR family methyltransferase [Steroidobacteraceae bacterium]|jgi:two-component system CheB/CheR fusion protein|nr:CheR family methyltransferase [Steroidobacteraceae bacterium]